MHRALISVLVLAAVALASIGTAGAQGDAPDPAVVPESVVITTGPDGNLALGITTASPWSNGPPPLDSWWMDFYFVSASGAMYDFGVQGEAPSHGQPVATEAYGTTDSGESMPQQVIADTSGIVWFLTSVPAAEVGTGPFSGSINFASWENLNTTQRQSNFWNFNLPTLGVPLGPDALAQGWDIGAGEPIVPPAAPTTVTAAPTTAAPTTAAPTTAAPITAAPTTAAPTTVDLTNETPATATAADDTNGPGGAGSGSGAAGSNPGKGLGAGSWIIIIGVILLILSGFMVARSKRDRLKGNTRMDLPSSHFSKELGDHYMDLPLDEQRRVAEEFKKVSDPHAYIGYVNELYNYHAGLRDTPPDPPVEAGDPPVEPGAI